MANKSVTSQKKPTAYTNQNPIETVKNFGSGTIKSAKNSFKQMGTGMFDQIMGSFSPSEDYDDQFENPFLKRKPSSEKKTHLPQRKEFTVFNYQEYYENQIVKRQIKELTEGIRKEIQMLKQANSSLMGEISDIQKLTVDSLPEKPGIYHIRFLELVLSILRNIRAKVGESRTWLQAMTNKRKKRGSLFVVNSKKKGTQYSLSQELTNARSIQ